MNNITKNQHYIPQCFLRNWKIHKKTSKKAKIWVFDKKNNIYSISIKKIASEVFFYEFNLTNFEKKYIFKIYKKMYNKSLETEYLNKILKKNYIEDKLSKRETVFGKAQKFIIDNLRSKVFFSDNKLIKKNILILKEMICLLLHRSPLLKNFHKNTPEINTLLDFYPELDFNNKENIKNTLWLFQLLDDLENIQKKECIERIKYLKKTIFFIGKHNFAFNSNIIISDLTETPNTHQKINSIYFILSPECIVQFLPSEKESFIKKDIQELYENISNLNKLTFSIPHTRPEYFFSNQKEVLDKYLKYYKEKN